MNKKIILTLTICVVVIVGLSITLYLKTSENKTTAIEANQSIEKQESNDRSSQVEVQVVDYQKNKNVEEVITGTFLVIIVVIVIFVICLPVILILMGFSFVSSFTSKPDSEKSRKPIFYQVPSNHVWVVRSAFGSKPGRPLYSIYENPKAYKVMSPEEIKEIETDHLYWPFSEGYKAWVPGLMVDEGIYDLEPKQRNTEGIKVNSRDKLVVFIDMQMTTFIYNAVRFAISMEGNNPEEKEKIRIKYEDDLLHTATNRACSRYNSEELQALVCRIYKKDNSEETRVKLWKILTREYEDEKQKDGAGRVIVHKLIKTKLGDVDEKDTDKYWKLAEDKYQIKDDQYGDKYLEATISLGEGIKEELKNLFVDRIYGIRIGQVGIKNIYTPDDVREALERERAAVIEQRTAKNEGLSLQEKIKLTGADPTKAYVVDTIADVLRPLLGKIGPSFKSKK